MINPIYQTTLIVGGNSHTYAFNALPSEILADQSLDLGVTITNADGSPFDLSGATGNCYITAYNVSGLVPSDLGAFTLTDSGSGTTDTVNITVDKDLIPDFLGDYPQDKRGSSVIYFEIQDSDSYIQIYERVNITSSDFSGDGSGNIDVPASSLSYDPTTPNDWSDPDPTTVGGGLDDLAGRVKTIEDNPAIGDMSQLVYDPQEIENDAFNRANMTGTQLSSTISDFDSSVSGNSSVSGSVTAHSDINSAGSGNIITDVERTAVGEISTHLVAVNPHNIDASTVGNDTAQWNANQIQGFNAPIPVGVDDDQKVLTYDDSSGQYQLVTPPGLGGGEANDLSLQGTGEDIRISKAGTDILTKGLLGTGTITTSTNANNIEINLPQSAEGVVGGVALANAGNVSNLDNDVAISPFRVNSMIGDKADSDLTINATAVDYTLLSGDKGSVIEVTNSITLPVLTQGYSCLIYNSSATASSITLSGTTVDNTTDPNISAKGSISVIYLSDTRIIIDGNTEA